MSGNGKPPTLKRFTVSVMGMCELRFTVEAASAEEAAELVWREEAPTPELTDWDPGTFDESDIEIEELGVG